MFQLICFALKHIRRSGCLLSCRQNHIFGNVIGLFFKPSTVVNGFDAISRFAFVYESFTTNSRFLRGMKKWTSPFPVRELNPANVVETRKKRLSQPFLIDLSADPPLHSVPRNRRWMGPPDHWNFFDGSLLIFDVNRPRCVLGGEKYFCCTCTQIFNSIEYNNNLHWSRYHVWIVEL